MADPTASLRGKTLVMVVGPSAVGKSTLMHAATELDDRFGYVQAFTTRPDRGDGTSTYRHLTPDQAEQMRSSGQAFTYVTHPTTGYIYGTDAQSYSKPYNLLDTLATSVDVFLDLPFDDIMAVSVTTDPDSWEAWLKQRYPLPSEERAKRLREAVISITWSLGRHQNHSWLVNREGELSANAKSLVDIGLRPGGITQEQAEARAMAASMLQRVKTLLSYEVEMRE